MQADLVFSFSVCFVHRSWGLQGVCSLGLAAVQTCSRNSDDCQKEDIPGLNLLFSVSETLAHHFICILHLTPGTCHMVSVISRFHKICSWVTLLNYYWWLIEGIRTWANSTTWSCYRRADREEQVTSSLKKCCQIPLHNCVVWHSLMMFLICCGTHVLNLHWILNELTWQPSYHNNTKPTL